MMRNLATIKSHPIQIISCSALIYVIHSMYHTIPITRVTDVVKGAKLYKLTSPLPPRHLNINSTCYYCGNRNVSYWSEEPNLQGNMQLRNSRWPICQKILSSSRSLLKCSNCIISRMREPKLINFTLIAFLLVPRGQASVFAQI